MRPGVSSKSNAIGRRDTKGGEQLPGLLLPSEYVFRPDTPKALRCPQLVRDAHELPAQNPTAMPVGASVDHRGRQDIDDTSWYALPDRLYTHDAFDPWRTLRVRSGRLDRCVLCVTAARGR